MSGQFSGFSKYTTEFLAAALGRGPEACCCCRCWDESKGSMLNPGKWMALGLGSIPKLQLGKQQLSYKYPTSFLQGCSPKPPAPPWSLGVHATMRPRSSQHQLLAEHWMWEVCERRDPSKVTASPARSSQQKTNMGTVTAMFFRERKSEEAPSWWY